MKVMNHNDLEMFEYSVLSEQRTSVQVGTTERRQETVVYALINKTALSIEGVSERHKYSLLDNAALLNYAITEERRWCGT